MGTGEVGRTATKSFPDGDKSHLNKFKKKAEINFSIPKEVIFIVFGYM